MPTMQSPYANLYAPIFVTVIFITFCDTAHSTSVAVLESKQGFVILSDSKQLHNGPDKTSCGADEIKKVFIANKRFAVSAIGNACASGVYRNNGVISELRYNIDSAWIQELQSSLPQDVSMRDFIKGLESKFASLLPELQAGLTSGYIYPDDSRNGRFETFVKFVIVGYDNGAPTICILDFNVDWDTHHFIEQPHGWAGDWKPIKNMQMAFYVFGLAQAVIDILDPKSYAYSYAMAKCPKAFNDFISGRPMSLDESVGLGRVLIQIEEKVNPGKVGGKITGVQILPNGTASELPDTTSLAKTKTRQQKR